MTDVQNDRLDDEDFDTILSRDIEFAGTIEFDKPFLIRGTVSGEIIAHDLLVIDTEARAEASITGKRVLVLGFVRGNVRASEKVELYASGTILGNVEAPEVYMETGCTFNGKCTMTKKG